MDDSKDLFEENSSTSRDPVRFVGRISDPTVLATIGQLTITVRMDRSERDLQRVAVDSAGRFLVRHSDDRELIGQPVEFLAQTRSGDVLARATATYPNTGEIEEVLINVPIDLPEQETRPYQAGDQTENTTWNIVLTTALHDLARALKHPRTERDGPPLVPRWVNRVIVELNEASRLARAIQRGDLQKSERFQALLSRDSPVSDHRSIAGSHHSKDGPQPAPLFFSPDGQPGSGGGLGGITGGNGLLGSGSGGASGPCLFDPYQAVSVAVGALILDIYIADRLDELIQPGAYTELAGTFLRQRSNSLELFREVAYEYADGQITQKAFEELSSSDGPLGELEPLLLPDHPSAISDGTSSSGGPSAPDWAYAFAPSGSLGVDVPEKVNKDPCNLWRDCVNEFETFAEAYRVSTQCPREDEIGQITPKAVCRGQTDVEIVIHPEEGATFSTSGTDCAAYFQRNLDDRQTLEILSVTEEAITVKLVEAEQAGCIGFRETSSGGDGNVGFALSCLRIGAIHNPQMRELITPSGQSKNVWCNTEGTNRLDVVPPPVLESLHASSSDESSSPQSSSSETIEAEACDEVVLTWTFSFGDQDNWVDPELYIDVEITDSAGNLVVEGDANHGSESVNEREDETYTVTGTATAAGEECGQAEGTITVKRVHKLHVEGLNEIQTGHTEELTVRSSCPVLEEDGLEVRLNCDHPDHLEVPPTVVIPKDADRISTPVTALGSDCITATVTAHAAGHLQSDPHEIEVFDVPKISAVNPSTVESCGPFEVTVIGSCFDPGETTVHMTKGEETRDLEIESNTTTEIVCVNAQEDYLSPGNWQLWVVSWGLESERHAIEVQPAVPTINTFLPIPSLVWPCIDSEVELLFEVQNAEHVKLNRIQDGSSTLVGDFGHPASCGAINGAPSDSAVGPRTYRLEAFQAGGTESITQEVVVGGHSIPTASTFRLINEGDHEWTIWTYSSGDASWNDTHVSPAVQTEEGPEESYSDVSLEDCSYYNVFAVDRDLMIENGQDPDDIVASLETSDSHQAKLTYFFTIPELETEENPYGEFHLLGRSNTGVISITVDKSGWV